MRLDNHEYCAVHYVENEDKECIYEFIRCSEGLVGSEARTRTILTELKRKYPELTKDSAWNELFKKSESNSTT